jgi:predicted ATPase
MASWLSPSGGFWSGCRSSSAGFSLDAAEAVCGGAGIEVLRILDLLQSLVDKSLVVADDDRSAIRYRFLETIRQFAAARLAHAGEGGMDVATVRQAHLRPGVAGPSARGRTGAVPPSLRPPRRTR